MNGEFEFGGYALQPLSGVGEAMYVAGVDGQIVDSAQTYPVDKDEDGRAVY